MNQNENNMLTLSSEAISAEVGVLGSMLIDEAAVGPVMMAVSEEDFLTQEAKRVFQAIRDRYARGEPVDPLLIAADLGDAYRPVLAKYIDETVTAANAEGYARALKRTSRLYRLRRLGEEELRLLLDLKRADNLAQASAYHGRQAEIALAEEILDRLLAEDACFSLKQLAVNGNDLTALGLRGPAVGRALETLLSKVVDGELPNQRAALLEFVINS